LELTFDGCWKRRNRVKSAVPVAGSGEPTEGEWDRIRGAVLRALLPFAEAREAVFQAMRELGAVPEESS
jgi:hypothetical protein